jgi:hypothetical protein
MTTYAYLDDLSEDAIDLAARALLRYRVLRDARAWYGCIRALGLRPTQYVQVSQLVRELDVWMAAHPSWVARRLKEWGQ